ncbi:GCN5-related N-acetyltransferase 6, chloroplastic-like [Salvia miltiorrhiza]|uniref:GCN5-related N-acetyltransferase 6, chloroplastic-like n=1 Tax=Salvia miltiorrhiza TaxID=226208 RepID=UPI0025AC50CC|nr:GCN5-related N-acetyltransferase 6, chloroplastic-like [Salvia miltiorrhiza]
MSSIALPIPYLSRTKLSCAFPRNLNPTKNTSTWGRIAMMNSAGKGKSVISDEENPLITAVACDLGECEPREAQLDEEYWAAAWLRAEIYWEGPQNERNAEKFKRIFAEREFAALKQRCDVQLGKNCTCILMVKKEEDDTIVNRVVGTLDFHVKFFSPGQTFPDEIIVHQRMGSIDRSASNSYGYILNICVARSARRRGVATTMLQHVISTAKEQSIKKVFLRVYGDNEGAVRLYEKVGFKAVEAPNCANCSAMPLLLMCFEV